MTTVLIIAEDDALRSAWVAAAVAAGLAVRAVGAMLPGVDMLGTLEIDGMLVDARVEGDLELLAAISAYRPMPPAVIVHDRDIALPARIRAAACRPTGASPERLIHLLTRLLSQRELARPTNLPVRVTPAAAKWTSRLSSSSDDGDSGDEHFDGETSPDGYDLAAG
jgi:DNA-binding NtrC family response regulator